MVSSLQENYSGWGRRNCNMTDKEFKRLSRSQLIEIIYQLQLKEAELTAENERLLQELEDRRIRVEEAGNVANAALELHNVMKAAQDAAQHYLDEIKIRVDDEEKRIMKEVKEQAAAILERAKLEAEELITKAKEA